MWGIRILFFLSSLLLLNEAASGRHVILNWTRAHVGVVGNEKADELAKEGAVGDNRVEVGPPRVELKNKIKETFYDLWRREFEEYEGARMGKQFYAGPDEAKAKHVIKLSRSTLSRFVRIISGHNSLFYFRHIVDNEVNPQCRFCLEADETFSHLVNDYPRFIIPRREKFLNQYISNDHMWSVQTLLDFSSLPGINDALEGDTRIELFSGLYGEDTDISSDSDPDSPD